jgi:cation diffusion facilitator CzcD-associated flavoprotein CzcO
MKACLTELSSLPMVQRKLDPVEEQKKKETGVYAEAFKKCESTAGGVTYERTDKNTFDDTPEEREKFYQSLVKDGGLQFWVAGYKDMMTDQKANDAAYDFWRRMVLKRINNPAKGELLAPEVPPHPYGAKRPSLEQNYFEVMNQDNVDIIDVNRFPIEEINATGLKTAAGQVDVDIIIFATGFDALTGGLMDIQIRGTDGRTLMQHWADGVKTSIGIAVPKFPNMFYLFGPQAPSTFS